MLFAFRYRHRKGREGIPPQVHGNTRLEIAWTILPAVILAGVAVPTVAGIFELAAGPRPPGIGRAGPRPSVVVGVRLSRTADPHRERAAHPDRPPRLPDAVRRRCRLRGVAPDPPSECQPGAPEGTQPASLGAAVIHSFWPPELAGTQDVIPGRLNHMVLQADEPGTYEGQCKEFCGLSHAYMRFTVVAHTPEDFERWVADQQAPAAPPDRSGGPRSAGVPGGRSRRLHGVPRRRRPAGSEWRDDPRIEQRTGSHALREPRVFRGLHVREQRREPAAMARRPSGDEARLVDAGLRPDAEQIDQLIAFLHTLE